MAASRHGCGDQGLRASTEAAAKGTPLYDQIPQNINLTWKALTQNTWINGDTDMMQFMQTVIGTIVVTKAQDDNTPGGYNYVPARAIDSDTLTALMQGGNVTIYTCAADATGDTTTNCLNVQQNDTSTINISAAAGFNARVTTSLNNLITDIVNLDGDIGPFAKFIADRVRLSMVQYAEAPPSRPRTTRRPIRHP